MNTKATEQCPNCNSTDIRNDMGELICNGCGKCPTALCKNCGKTEFVEYRFGSAYCVNCHLSRGS